MKQTLIYLPTEIFGRQLFGNGLLFWAILIVGLVFAARCVLKKRFDDALFYATITALGVGLVKYVGPQLLESGGFPIRGYGVFLTLAILISTILTIWRAKRRWNYPVDSILSIVFVAAFFGVVGARLFYVVEYWSDIQCNTFGETLISVVNIANGGLVVYGSILGGIAAVVVYLKIKKLPLFATLDLFAPALALGVAIGRIGCLMNGCCFGATCDLPWAIVFPSGSPAHTLQMEEGVASLYGLTLEPPRENRTPIDAKNVPQNAQNSETVASNVPKNSENSSKTLFSIKSTHKNLASEKRGPVYVAAVDPGSPAEEAGIAPGARICELGLVPKGFFVDDASAKRREIQRFRPENNAQVFYFFLHSWAGNPEKDVWLVLQDPSIDANPQTAASQLRNVVFHPKASRPAPVHPTQIYSSLATFSIFVALLILARFVRRDGLVFAGLLILYPTARFCLELIRTDEESFLGTGLTVSQCVSLGLLTLGLALLVYIFVTPPKRELVGFFPAPDASEKSSQNPSKSMSQSADAAPKDAKKER